MISKQIGFKKHEVKHNNLFKKIKTLLSICHHLYITYLYLQLQHMHLEPYNVKF
jgi:hypothetical protein